MTEGLTCALHLDDKDAGHLPNLIVSLGLNRENEVVPLRGCLLMVVALYAETNLAGKVLPGGFAQAHDAYGNIVLLEPPTAQLDLPEGLSPQEVPERESSVRLAMREGRGRSAPTRRSRWAYGMVIAAATTPLEAMSR